MNFFESSVRKFCENISGEVFGNSPLASPQFSGDNYAPGDSRNLFGLKDGKKGRKKKKSKRFPLIRRKMIPTL